MENYKYPFLGMDGEIRDLKTVRGPLILRENFRVERICKHGNGHPIGHLEGWEEWMREHGCECNCCKKWKD